MGSVLPCARESAQHRATKHETLSKLSNMNKIVLLCLVGLLQLVPAQRSYKAKFSDCGSILKIAPALQGSVSITAPYNSQTGRHILGKGKNVKICINGTIVPNSLPLPIAGAGLKTSAHGKLLLGALTVPLPVEFCDLKLDSCPGATPSCQDMKYGDEVQLCSALTVPTASPDVDVEVTWKVLREEVSDPSCETEFDLAKLKQKNKLPLVCINIPARVQPPRTRG
eukprot:TRINITY_DN4079_c0_g1_i4.p1 TRINITY_DN4079_c0_g1~~TRINITY_DN4079_c0_g1_i4.p1  ORF type:complete len:225 (+),score=36.33 TRINITY_DN4079_c0_g1_i4:94-768(+)